MEWAQVATLIGGLAAVIGLQSFWIARSIDALRGEMYRGFDSVDRRFDSVERRLDRLEDHEPPSLRRV